MLRSRPRQRGGRRSRARARRRPRAPPARSAARSRAARAQAHRRDRRCPPLTARIRGRTAVPVRAGGTLAAMDGLRETALALVAGGKGILAADESEGTIEKRLSAVGVESTEGGGEPTRLPRPPHHRSGRRGVSVRRDPLRRDDPPELERRHAVRGAPRGSRDHSRRSRSTRARNRSRAPRARPSPRVSTVCGNASRSTSPSAPDLRSGVA